MIPEVHLIQHPLVLHKLTIMRRVETHTQDFRRLLKEISMLLAYEVTRDLPLKYETIKTPMTEMSAPMLAADKKMVIVSIMRAGQGLLDGMIELMPTAKVGHIGLYREPTTLMAVEYYLKLPPDIEQRDMLVVGSDAGYRQFRRCSRRIASKKPVPPRFGLFVCSPLPKASSTFTNNTPMYRSSPPRSTRD